MFYGRVYVSKLSTPKNKVRGGGEKSLEMQGYEKVEKIGEGKEVDLDKGVGVCP